MLEILQEEFPAIPSEEVADILETSIMAVRMSTDGVIPNYSEEVLTTARGLLCLHI